jgi:hypothetical protein
MSRCTVDVPQKLECDRFEYNLARPPGDRIHFVPILAQFRRLSALELVDDECG